MDSVSELRDRIVELVGQFEHIIVPVLKFILMLVTVLVINSKLGYMDKLTNIAIVFGVSLIAAFLPLNFSVVISALFILAHLFKLSPQLLIVVGMVFAVMFVLYFRFSPKDAALVMVIPLFYIFKLPYLGAMLAGILCGPLSFISVSCGTVVYYIVSYVSGNSDKFSSSFSAENALSGFKTVIDNVLNNDAMLVMVVALSVMAVLINVIKRFSFDYSWYVALAIGTILGLIVVIIGSSAMDADLGIGGAIVSTLFSAIITFVIILFIRNIDYSSAEYVSFEDDEFVYYVKAIPRVTTRNSHGRKRRVRRDDDEE